VQETLMVGKVTIFRYRCIKPKITSPNQYPRRRWRPNV